MLRKLTSSLAVLLFVAVSTAAGQLKVAYMNPNEVLNQLPEKTQIEQQLNDLIEQKRGQLQTRTANFQEAVAEYRQNRDAMSQQQRQQREQELAKMEQGLRQFQQSIQAEIQQRRSQLLSPIFNRMDQVIADIAEERNIDFVLNEATDAGETIIYYAANQELNITQEVIDRMTNGTNQQN